MRLLQILTWADADRLPLQELAIRKEPSEAAATGPAGQLVLREWRSEASGRYRALAGAAGFEVA